MLMSVTMLARSGYALLVLVVVLFVGFLVENWLVALSVAVALVVMTSRFRYRLRHPIASLPGALVFLALGGMLAYLLVSGADVTAIVIQALACAGYAAALFLRPSETH